MICGLSPSRKDLEVTVIKEIALSIYGLNNIEKVGLGRKDTMRMSMEILMGDAELEYVEW